MANKYYLKFKSDPIRWAKMLEQHKKYKKENWKKIKRDNQIYQRTHRKELSRKQSIWQSTTPKGKFKQYRETNARSRGLDFSLTFDQFMSFWQKDCYYCGRQVETIGLDRVDNDQGYRLDNIVSCCRVCNRMRMDLNQEHFINQCRDIAVNMNLKSNENKITSNKI